MSLGSFMDFWNNLGKYQENKTVQKYLEILGIDYVALNDVHHPQFETESQKFSDAFIKNRPLFNKIINSILDGESLAWLEMYSAEQQKYITSPNTGDTKLIACAGSGKTRSIIGRIKFMTEHGIVEKENVYAITFSKSAATDFQTKIQELFPDHQSFCVLKNFSTIDSLAKSILCRVKSHKSENVEILSIALRNFLRIASKEEFKKIDKNIKHLFVDEAQDLNEAQYDICMLLKKHYGTILHFIGDPNQNIFQFRRSSSSFMMNFPSQTFELTKNYRSSQQIIDFAEGFKTVPTSKSSSANNLIGEKVTILQQSSTDIHKFIVNFVKSYQKDLSQIAIICPTRGIKAYDSVGLSVLFNLFKTNNISFNQLYDESGLSDDRKKNVEKIPGHINLMTYHGTKGLEFDVVFVMDFYQHLFNIQPTEEEHNVNRYLLYVACSRAISAMYICTYTNVHGGFINHWITQTTGYLGSAKIPKLGFRSKEQEPAKFGVTEIISELNDEQLDLIDDMMTVEENEIVTNRLYADHTHIDRGKDETLFGIFCEELFYFQYFLVRKETPRSFLMIEYLLESKFIVVKDDSEVKLLRTYLETKQMTWSEYDLIKATLPIIIIQLIEKYFKRDNSELIANGIICTNEFVTIVTDNMDDIRKTYSKYTSPAQYQYEYFRFITDFFYLIVVQYAYNNNHYYYINNHGADKQYLLTAGESLFININSYACRFLLNTITIKQLVHYQKLLLMGEIDYIDHDIIVEIKCVKEISIKYYLQLLLYNFCYRLKMGTDINKIYTNQYRIVNFLTGLEHNITIKVSTINMFNILNIISEVGHLNFNQMNLVYDLETTDLIREVGPFNSYKTIPRTNVFKRGEKYMGEQFPEIIEIAIRDYESGMIILNTLVKPSQMPSSESEKITGITQSMLVDCPGFSTVKIVLEKKMKNFINCKMLAHNGSRFDDRIMKYDNLIDTKKVSFIDTMNIIPMHMPNNTKLESKKLGSIYKSLFKEDFKAHRAMADVNALIKIMKHLQIKL